MNLSYAFIVGMVATVNPCGFVLLPAYLTYFLGTEGSPGVARAPVQRAIVVSVALSGGFLATFLVVGAVAQAFAPVLAHARFLVVVVAVVFVVVGVGMLAGFRLSVPFVRVESRGDRSLRTMFVYGVAYSAASISCSLPLFSTVVVFGAVRRSGTLAGVGNAVAYAAGMALVVSALTIAVALARPGLLGGLRVGMRHLHTVAGILMVGSGLYLLWYFWNVDLNGRSDPVTNSVQRVQLWAQSGLEQHWGVVSIVGALGIGAATAFVAVLRLRSSAAAGGPAASDEYEESPVSGRS